MKVADDGDGRLCVATGAEMPLQVADPENEIGNDGSTGIEFKAEELMRVDGKARVFEGLLRIKNSATCFGG